MKLKFKNIFSNLEEIFASLFLIVTTVLVLLNVFLRYFLKTGIYWTEEVATGCFVWSIFLGSAAGYKRRMHVGVDFLVNKLQGKLKKIIRICIDIVLLFINIYITYISVLYIQISYTKPTPVLGISTVFISASILVSFTLMSVYSIKFLINDILQKESGR